ncbi:hypothetical protein BOTCAL_0056g00140 [Botryotinia calthae]|uniref:Uncharacterized protein n=1 Tax=Botryotinia calthae TaxID=38488 RepID=A0A4Y8DCR4_9HELO|nr:hypothetical protein BOTCAL_0056g00140 [Botryotinia calthae]
MKEVRIIRDNAVAVKGTNLKFLFSAMVATGPVHMLANAVFSSGGKNVYKEIMSWYHEILTSFAFTINFLLDSSLENHNTTMDSPRVLKTRNSNITYQIMKKNRPPASSSTSSKRIGSKSKPKPLENLEVVNKLPPNTGLFSPASSDGSLSVNDSDFEDSDEGLVEVTLQPQSKGPNLDFYKDKMEDLTKTYKEIIDRRSSPEAQRTSSCLTHASSSSTSSSKRHNRRSQDDISNANLLLLLRMVE